MSWIERIEVEEGFLDGLDLEFSRGLNVVIGARGTGKTSMLELIRFALGAPAFTERAAAAADAQVRAVLGRGKVTLTVRDASGEVRSVSRSVDSKPSMVLQATVLAQNEIEAVGASAAGRLHLVDRFLDSNLAAEIDGAATKLLAVGKTIDSGQAEIVSLQSQLAELPELETRLIEVQVAQEQALERAEATEDDKQKLAELQAGAQLASLRHQILDQTVEAVSQLEQRLRVTSETSPPPDWPDDAGPDPVAEATKAFTQGVERARIEADALHGAIEGLAKATAAESDARSLAESQSREIRRRLGAVDAEVTTLSNEVAKLNERIGNLKGLDERLADRIERQRVAIEERASLYVELEDLRQQRFDLRSEVVLMLNKSLKPAIQLDIVQSAQRDDYENRIIAALRGSGLHSRTMAPELASACAPIELVEKIEARDAASVAAMTSLSISRVESAFERLRDSDPSALAAVVIDDEVDLFLLDVGKPKPSDELSIGQRCTAVLPVLLERHGDVLIIDQPEDHLDNAFVTSTLVESLRNRQENHQLILSSHNANVPVLGNADRVVHMSSDGNRGFVEHVGELDELGTVRAVTDVMEGGADAFRRRSEFYEQHGYA